MCHLPDFCTGIRHHDASGDGIGTASCGKLRGFQGCSPGFLRMPENEKSSRGESGLVGGGDRVDCHLWRDSFHDAFQNHFIARFHSKTQCGASRRLHFPVLLKIGKVGSGISTPPPNVPRALVAGDEFLQELVGPVFVQAKRLILKPDAALPDSFFESIEFGENIVDAALPYTSSKHPLTEYASEWTASGRHDRPKSFWKQRPRRKRQVVKIFHPRTGAGPDNPVAVAKSNSEDVL